MGQNMELELLAIAKAHETIHVAEAAYKKFFEQPKLRFDLKGSTAGKAWYRDRDWLIQINRDLLYLYPEQMIERTVPHEVAHLVTSAMHPVDRIKPHGTEWRSVMRTIGLEPERCHTYDVSAVRRQRAGSKWYKCIQCGRKYSLGKKRVLNMLESGNMSSWCACSHAPNLVSE